MKIEVLGSNIQIETEKEKGLLDTSSRDSAKEFGKVLAVGEDVVGIKRGDKVFFKSWACDIINHDDKRYVFINQKTGGILAKVND